MAKKQFQTEIKQLLDLMIHSLYSNKEIFLRELISNANDALDKLNYLTLSDDAYKRLDFNPKITISFDSNKNTISIEDNGIGMNEEDLENNLGTIAKSGTKSFLNSLSGDKKKDAGLIGQFGVGFYSSFMVADKVVVNTKKALDSKAYTWISSVDGEYEILESSKEGNGTEITLYLNESGKTFLSRYSLENIIKTYSNHIHFPIFIKYYEKKDSLEELKEEQVNNAKALWCMSKSELKDEDYHDFYKTIHFGGNKPLAYVHTIAEGSLQYKSLFFVMDSKPGDFEYERRKSYVKLYVKRVFISDDSILPFYLRFITGVIDSDDLPLNVSREILQENQILGKIKEASIKKILGMLENLAKDSEKYNDFYEKFGDVLKWGLYEDYSNKAKILDLLRIHSYRQNKRISLKEYKEGMKEGQDRIYYIVGNGADSLKNNPLLEKFKDEDILLFGDIGDIELVNYLGEYSGMKFADITSKEVLDSFKSEIGDEVKKSFESLIKKFEGMDSVSKVELTDSITSPLSLVRDGGNIQLDNMMKAMGQKPLPSKYVVEINVNHELIKKVNEMDDSLKDKYCKVLFSGAKILDGQNLEDSKSYVESVNELLMRGV